MLNIWYIYFSLTDSSLSPDIKGGDILFHSCRTIGFVNIKVDECPRIAAEYHLIGGISLFSHLYIHDGRIILGCTPVIRAMAIVVDTPFQINLCIGRMRNILHFSKFFVRNVAAQIYVNVFTSRKSSCLQSRWLSAWSSGSHSLGRSARPG